jgi:hypothetical protein
VVSPAHNRSHHAATASGRCYARHGPEETLLYQTIEQHWAEFRERADEQGGLPKFVGREVEEYLRCGRLDYGCLRLGAKENPTGRKDRGLRILFDKVVLGMTPDEVARHWVDQRIRGKGRPPRAVPDGALLKKVVRHFPGAIAYLPTAMTRAGWYCEASVRWCRPIEYRSSKSHQ